MEHAIPGLANSAILSLLLINAARSYAAKVNLIDRPGGRKQHVGAVPTVGGICIYCAFLLGLSIDPNLLAVNIVGLAAMGLLVCVGAFDDAINVGPAKKLVVQIVAAVALVAVISPPVGPSIGLPQLHGVIGSAFAVVMIVCVMNAINMADGIDGLAGWLVTVALVWLMIGAAIVGHGEVCELALRLSVPVLAFLVFNSRAPWRATAAVFMGDAGTLMLGCAISWFCLELADRGVPLVASSLVVSVPVSDTISLFFRRLMAGRSPFSGDRSHMHHLLEAAGFRPGTISVVLATVSAVIGGIGILGAWLGLPPEFFLVVWLAVFTGHCIVIRLIGARGCTEQLRVARGGT
jgi:UDP-GlcNAc:undecaprenyl-phosphate GlcNAc-1-phosphate transferase